MWYIGYEDIENIAVGAGILGTGGGGNPYLGKLMVRRCLDTGVEIPVLNVDDISDDATCVSVGGMGAPTVSVEKIQKGDEPLVALRALEEFTGRRADYLVPWEIGGTNSTRPLVQAAYSGLPVIDADSMGRAFPELQMCTFSIYGIPTTPAAIADVRGDVALFAKTSSPQLLERYARAVTIEMGGSTGFAFPIMTGKDLKRTAIPGTLSFARDIGQAVRRARSELSDPIAALLAVSGGDALFEGKLTSVERRLAKGFARGEITLDGMGDFLGDTLRIQFQNENLVAERDGQIVASVPDLISIVDIHSAEPVTTEVLRYGLRVAVLGIPAPRLLRTEQALSVVGPRNFGLDVDYVPLPGEYGTDRRSASSPGRETGMHSESSLPGA